MRLTLRTMLAYMDDILEPDNAQEIGRKIEESEFANSLMHRIRDVTRRLRLGAPHLGDQKAGLNANTVAEYLDNSLSPDRVPDFEKVCLESDMHLAEVASCHQILTLVLGEAAEVDPVSRQRMYQLPDLMAAQAKAVAAPAAASVATPVAAPVAEAPAPDGRTRSTVKEAVRRPRPSVPDYLREETTARRRRWSLLAAALIVACAGVVGWGLVDRFGPALLRKLFGITAQDQTVADAKATGVFSPDSPTASTEVSKGLPSPSPNGTGSTPPDSPTASTEVSKGLPSPSPNGTGSTPPDSPTASTEVSKGLPSPSPNGTGSTPPDSPTASTDASKGLPSPPSKETETASQGPQATSKDVSKESLPPEQGRIEPAAKEVAMIPGLAQPETIAGAKPKVTEGAEQAPLPPEQVGRYISPREVLLKVDGETLNWVRLGDQGPLAAGDHCLSLPTYRPVMMLGDDLHLQLIDATHVFLLPNDPAPGLEKTPGVLVDSGSVVLTTEGKPKMDLRLQIGQRRAVIRFTDDPATLAIQVGRGEFSGGDPETQPAPVTAELYVTRGRILWQDVGSREVVSVSSPAEISLSSLPATTAPLAAIPNWIDAGTISVLDQRASTTMEKEMKPNQPVLLTLRELAEHRQREVRWLALRCLAAVGDFALVVAALDNPEHKTMWTEYADLLRAAVGRSPTDAAQVRGAIERVYGGPAKTAAGASLYELLWHYQPPRLTPEDGARLVGCLENDILAIRVLSFWNLKNITGLGLYYRPEDPAVKREVSLQKWKERLKESPTLRGRVEEGKAPSLPPSRN